MQICPKCASKLGDLDIICASCGHVVGVPGAAATSWSGAFEEPSEVPVVPPDPPAVSAEVIPPVAAAEPHVVPPVATTKPPTTPKTTSHNAILAAAAIGLAAVVVFIVRSSMSNAQTSPTVGAAPTAVATSTGVRTSTTAATPRNPVARPPAGVAQQPESTSEPKWSRTRQLQWGTDGSRIIGFELQAEREVPVYLDRVRPILAVRCTSRQTEVFVVLRSAASIESGSDTHAVRIGLDDQPDVEERWLDSSDMQALFAPDGKALAARLGTARHLRFGFKPFNAAPAVVEFDVHGFEGPLAAMAKTCAPASKRGPLPRS